MLKRFLLTISILLISIFLLRGWLFRQLVHYKTIGHRTEYPVTDLDLARLIDQAVANDKPADVETAIRVSLRLTAQHLHFVAAKNDNDPNLLIHSKKAHCVGYAAFFSTVCNAVLTKAGLATEWVARPQVGAIYFLGVNVHRYFKTPFFRDHDFDSIENKQSEAQYLVDPTVYEYFGIVECKGM